MPAAAFITSVLADSLSILQKRDSTWRLGFFSRLADVTADPLSDSTERCVMLPKLDSANRETSASSRSFWARDELLLDRALSIADSFGSQFATLCDGLHTGNKVTDTDGSCSLAAPSADQQVSLR